MKKKEKKKKKRKKKKKKKKKKEKSLEGYLGCDAKQETFVRGNRDSQPEIRPVGVVNIEVIRIPSRYSCFLTNHTDWGGGGGG